MLILASDTSGPSVSVALWQDGRLLGEMMQNIGLTHSVTYLPLVENMLRQCKKDIAEVDLFAVTVGPGSFTGIRIGISAVKAMAYAAQKPAVGVSTLEAMAWPYRCCPDLLVCPMLDARNGRVYACAWQNGNLILPEANQVLTDFIEQVSLYRDRSDSARQPQSDYASQTGSQIMTLGCALPQAILTPDHAGRPIIQTAPAMAWLPRAAAVAEIAAQVVEDGFEQLDAPIRRIAAPDTPVPFSPVLEKAFIPQVEDVAGALRELAGY